MANVTFTDPHLQARFERNLTEADGGDDLRLLTALMATYRWFRTLEGPDSQRVQAAMGCLLSQEHRPALRRWYQHPAGYMDVEAYAFRDLLSQLAGERLQGG